jgi:hypothetical protein
MFIKYLRYLIVFLYYLSLSQFPSVVINAQKHDSYLLADTIKVTNDPTSMILIIKIDTSLIKHKYSIGSDMITHIEIYDYSNNLLVQSINDTSESHSFAGGVDYIDINLDGYLDIDIDLGVSNLTPIHSFWLFEKLDNKFYYSPDFSQLNAYNIDLDKKEINSYSQSTGGRGGSSEKYKVENGNLYLIETEYSNYYDYERKELINGILRTVEVDELNEVKDDEGNYINVINSYNLVDDSLLLTEKNWLIEFKGEDYSKYDSDTYDCGPWGG